MTTTQGTPAPKPKVGSHKRSSTPGAPVAHPVKSNSAESIGEHSDASAHAHHPHHRIRGKHHPEEEEHSPTSKSSTHAPSSESMVTTPSSTPEGLRSRVPAAAPAEPATVETKKGFTKSITSVWGSYLLLLSTYPLFTKSATCAVIACLGDMMCQLVIEQAKELDWERSVQFILVNGVVVGPGLHYWFSVLCRLIPRPGLSGAVIRLLPDQLLFAPVFNFTILSFIATLKAGSPTLTTLEDLREMQVASWVLWPVTNLMIFWLSPPDLQVLWGNIVALLWNTYLSMLLAGK